MVYFKIFSSVLNHLVSVLLQDLFQILSPAPDDDASRAVLCFFFFFFFFFTHTEKALGA